MNPYLSKIEKSWSEFSISFSKNLPEQLKTYAFLYPSSYRNPEIEYYFHPSLKRRALLNHLIRLPRSFVRGIDAWLRGRFGAYLYNKNINQLDKQRKLIIAPRILCKMNNSQVSSNYLSPDDSKSYSWLLFEEGKPTNSNLTRKRIFHLYFKFLFSLFSSFINRPNSVTFLDWLVAFLTNLNWHLSLYWADKLGLENFLENLLEKNEYQHLHCIHEFHPHSKIIWKVAHKFNIRSSGIEHASNEREKLWLFPTKKEVENGNPIPTSLGVYNTRHQKWWEEIFNKKIEYVLCCSPRYSKWKTKERLSQQAQENSVLLVTSQSWWDNEVIFQAIDKLLKESSLPLTVRLHPFAQLNTIQKKWLKEKEVNSRLKIDRSDLFESIKVHSLLLGMCSTVLDEGLLLGRCAIKIEHDDFSSLGSTLAYSLHIQDLSENTIFSILKSYENESSGLVEKAKDNFGLAHPIGELKNL